MMRRIAGFFDRKIFHIYEGKRIYFGGNQDWFAEKRARHGGCGIIAAANAFIQLAQYPAYADLYKNVRERTEKKDYIVFIEKLYQYIRPLYIFGISFGIWNGSRLIKGIKDYAKTMGIEIAFERRYPRQSYQKTRSWLFSRLQQGKPVMIMIGLSNLFKNTTVVYPNGRRLHNQNLARHWMTVSALLCDEKGDEYLQVSTWGGSALIKLRDWNRGFWPQVMLCMT